MNMKQFIPVLLVALIGGVIGGALSGNAFRDDPASAERPSKPKKVLEAQGFRLVDENGVQYALITIREETGQAALAFYDNEGKERFVLGINYDKQPGMALYDKGGAVNLALGVPEAGKPNLSMYNYEGSQTLGIGQEGLYLLDGNGRTRTFLGRNRLNLSDENGTLRTAVGILELKRNKANPALKRPISSLVLFDKQGSMLWSAP